MQVPRRDFILLCSAALFRSFATGLLGVLLGLYLARRNASAGYIGAVIATGIAGAALATALVSWRGDRFGRRRTLLALALLSALGLIGLALANRPATLLPLVFIGMVNGAGTDRSAAYALDQAIIPGLVRSRRVTWAISWYNLVLDAGGAVGAMAAVVPALLHRALALSWLPAYQFVFFGVAALHLVSAAAYAGLSPDTELAYAGAPLTRQVSPQTRSVVMRLCRLFAIDSFAGGFLTDALVAYWFFQRFGVSERSLAAVFFVVHLLNALSHLGAAWLADRIGLLNTMVFTHLPSSLFLIGAAFAPNFKIAVALFFLREALVEMDVPSRQSFVAAIVAPHERTYASGATNLTRTVSWAAASSVAGVGMQLLGLSTPLLAGGSLKILYDVLLYRGFRQVQAGKHPDKILRMDEPPNPQAAHQW